MDISEAYKFGTEQRVNKIAGVLSRRQLDLTVVAENISDPHNLSAMMRSCDAVGIASVCLVYHSGQPFPTLGEASSASARKWVETLKFRSIEECYKFLRQQGFKIYTTHLAKDAVSLYELDLTQKVALVFGNEHSGVSDEAVGLADGNFLIPQVGMIQSLNISVACAVSIYEAFRQRLLAGKYDHCQFEEQAFVAKIKEWLLR